MKHTLKFTATDVEVKNKDLEVTVSSDSGKIGTLKISKGNIEWVPKDHTYGFTLTWKKFDEAMREAAGGKK